METRAHSMKIQKYIETVVMKCFHNIRGTVTLTGN